MRIELYPPLSIYEMGQRDNQEDSLWPVQASVDDRLFVLCDGMGGYEYGEVASQIVSQTIGSWYHARAIHPLNKPQIEDALSHAYAQLDMKDAGELRKMGTTLTILYFVRKYYMNMLWAMFPQMQDGSMWPALCLGIGLFIVVSLINIVAVRNRVMKIWNRKE